MHCLKLRVAQSLANVASKSCEPEVELPVSAGNDADRPMVP